MVNAGFKGITENDAGKGFWKHSFRSRKITAFTPYGTCTERLSPFGGLLGMIKFLDLLNFEEAFDRLYRGPGRDPRLGHYRMVVGIMMLLFRDESGHRGTADIGGHPIFPLSSIFSIPVISKD